MKSWAKSMCYLGNVKLKQSCENSNKFYESMSSRNH